MLFQRKGRPRTVKISVKWAGRDVFLLYRLFYEPYGVREDDLPLEPVYSVSVHMVDWGGWRVCVENAHDVARSEAEALCIFKTVSRGLVTPETLLEIVSDVIGIFSI